MQSEESIERSAINQKKYNKGEVQCN
jgi:hypothetical protein